MASNRPHSWRDEERLNSRPFGPQPTEATKVLVKLYMRGRMTWTEFQVLHAAEFEEQQRRQAEDLVERTECACRPSLPDGRDFPLCSVCRAHEVESPIPF